MEISSLPLLNNVLDVIHIANYSLDSNLIRQKVFEVFLKGFDHDGALFFLPDANARFSNIIISNLDEAYNKTFQKYYHKFDPLHLSERSQSTIFAGPPTQCISYDRILSSEYYNDFLRPQKIHYKLVARLESLEGVLGKIVLTRPADSINFSTYDVKLAQALCPYLAQALSINDLRRKISVKDNILQFIESDLSTGILLIDESMHLVYINQKARELCRRLCGYSGSSGDRRYVHPDLMDAFRKLIQANAYRTGGTEITRRQRTVVGNNGIRISVYAKFINNGAASDGGIYYMIYVSELKSDPAVQRNDLRQTFQLSKREMDVMGLIFKGLKNSEIARALFVSEITVKKHIQKIYAKVGVKNRTSLMNKVMATQGAPPFTSAKSVR
jgi:DNA-binding CsgD family transcriptional regulator